MTSEFPTIALADAHAPRLLPARLGVACALLAALLGAAVLLGWWLNLPGLITAGMQQTTMKPNAALCVLLAGAGIALAADRRWRWLSVAAGGAVLLITGATLVEHLSGLDLWLDRALLPRGLDLAAPVAGRMSPITAVALASAGIALLGPQRRAWPELGFVVAGTFGFAAVLGYLVGAPALYALPGFSAVAVHAGVGCLLLGVAGILTHTQAGLGRQVAAPDSGGELARRLLPAAILLPVALGWVRVAALQLGTYPAELGVAVSALASAMLFAGATLLAARQLSRLDRARSAQAQVQAQQEISYRAAFENAAFGHAVADAQWRLVSVNAAYCRLVGYSAEELHGGAAARVTHPDERAAERGAYEALQRGDLTHYTADKRYLRGDGQVVWGRLSVAPIRAVDGSVQGFHAQVVDITARKQAEQALAASEERFALAMQGTLEGLYDVDLPQDRVWISPQFEALLGHAPNTLARELRFSQLLGQLHPDDHAGTTAALARHLEQREVFDIECRMRTAKGAYRWVRLRAGAVWDATGQAVRLVGTMSDVHEGRERQEALERSLTEQAALQRELADFTAAIAHDLRAPLRHMNGYTAILSTEAAATLEPDHRRLVDRIHAASERMGMLVDALLDFSQISRRDLHRTRVNVAGIAQELVAKLAPQGHSPQRHNIEWRIVAAGEVYGDVALLGRALMHLLRNAVQHTAHQNPAVIEVRTDATVSPDGRRYDLIEVHDNGDGFDPAHAGRMFELFTRLHADSGVGMGLATVRRIAERHGGYVMAAPRLVGGTTMTLALPVPN